MRLALLLLVGCAEPKNFPPGGGGGGGGGGGTPKDSGVDTPSDAIPQTGRVCAVRDLRDLTTCDDKGVGDIAINLGPSHAETDEDGSFTIDLPSGTGLTWEIIHPSFVTTISQFGTSFIIPIIRLDDYDDLRNDNGVIFTSGQSTVVVQVLGSGLPLSGAMADVAPQAQFATRYDGNNPLVWDQDSTGTFGVAWLPGTSGTSTSLTVTPPTGSPATSTIPIQAESITFVTVSF